MENGWIKLHRCLLEHPLWRNGTPEQKVVLVTLLLMANHAPRQWEWQGRPYECQSGQMVTSLASIKKLCGKGVTIQNIRTSLHRFERFGFLTYQSTKSNRLITICHWETWQCEETQANKATNKRVTNESQTANKHLTTNKNDKNSKNVKKDKKREGAKRERFATPTLEEIQSFILQNQYAVDAL